MEVTRADRIPCAICAVLLCLTSRGGMQFSMDLDEPVGCVTSSGMCE